VYKGVDWITIFQNKGYHKLFDTIWNECVNRAAILKQGSPSTLMHQCRQRPNGNKMTINHHEWDFSHFFCLFQRSDLYFSLIPIFFYLKTKNKKTFFLVQIPSVNIIRECSNFIIVSLQQPR